MLSREADEEQQRVSEDFEEETGATPILRIKPPTNRCVQLNGSGLKQPTKNAFVAAEVTRLKSPRKYSFVQSLLTSAATNISETLQAMLGTAGRSLRRRVPPTAMAKAPKPMTTPVIGISGTGAV